MILLDHARRLRDYYARHGLRAVITRTVVQTKRAVFSGRMVVFYCDLDPAGLPSPVVPASITLQRVTRFSDLNADDVQRMTGFWNPAESLRRMHARFAKQASLWIARAADGNIAGFGWSLRAGTMEPYFFPLAASDIHLFDFHVFEEYRGRGVNPLLVGNILTTIAAEGGRRAFIECAEWNRPQLCSLSKTPFRYLGNAKTSRLFGSTFCSWTEAPVTEVRSLAEPKSFHAAPRR